MWIWKFKNLLINNKPRLIIYSILICAIVLTKISYTRIDNQNKETKQKEQMLLADAKNFNSVFSSYKKLKSKLKLAKLEGVNTSASEEEIRLIGKDLFINKKYNSARSSISNCSLQLDQQIAQEKEKKRLALEAQEREEEAKRQAAAEALTKGEVTGLVTCGGSPCSGATVKLTSGGTAVASYKTSPNGIYLFNVKAGTYKITVSKSGYQFYSKSGLVIIAQQKITTDIALVTIPIISPTPAPAPSNSTPPANNNPNPSGGTSPTLDSRQELLNIINAYRKSKNLSELRLDSLLNKAATDHSQWMYNTGNLSHTGENNSTPWQRCAAAGTSCSGEIIAYAGIFPETAFDLWKNSPGHNAIMLGNYSSIGIGIVGPYVTADFKF